MSERPIVILSPTKGQSGHCMGFAREYLLAQHAAELKAAFQAGVDSMRIDAIRHETEGGAFTSWYIGTYGEPGDVK